MILRFVGISFFDYRFSKSDRPLFNNATLSMAIKAAALNNALARVDNV